MEASPSTKPVFVVVGGGIAGVSCAEEVRVYYCVKECKTNFQKELCFMVVHTSLFPSKQ